MEVFCVYIILNLIHYFYQITGRILYYLNSYTKFVAVTFAIYVYSSIELLFSLYFVNLNYYIFIAKQNFLEAAKITKIFP